MLTVSLRRIGLLLVFLALPVATTATNVSYTLDGVFDVFIDVEVTPFGSPGAASVNSATLRDSFDDDVIDLIGGLPLLLAFGQDTSVPLTSPAGPNGSRFAGAISNTELSIDDQTAAVAASDDLFGFDSNNQHQWSIFAGGATPQGVLSDNFFGAVEFDFNGEAFQFDDEIFYDGFNLFLIDQDESLFSVSPPDNAPFFGNSFDQPGDFVFLNLIWRTFVTLEDQNQVPFDFDIEVVLSADITNVQSSAVPVPAPLPLLLFAAGLSGIAVVARNKPMN